MSHLERLSDEALVQLVCSGDHQAFSEIVKRYEKQIYGLAYRLTNHKDDAQDLAQEAFIKIFQVINKFDPGKQFFSWMYKVAVNHCYSKLRKKSPQTVPLDNIIEFKPLVPETAAQPEEYAQMKEVQELVQKAIAELPEKYRFPLVMRYLEEFSYKEIASSLELPVTTIETRLYRAKMLLQKRLAFLLEGEERSELSRS